MLKIRLQRIGRKNDPAFRVIVTESTRGPKSGNHVELLGSYNPRQNTSNINAERVRHWISKGAQVSGTVHNLLVSQNAIEGAKMNVLPKKSPIAKEVEEAASGSGDAETEKATEGEAAAEVAGDGGEETASEAPNDDQAPAAEAQEGAAEAAPEQNKSAEPETKTEAAADVEETTTSSSDAEAEKKTA